MVYLRPSDQTHQFPGGQVGRLHWFKCPRFSEETLALKVNGNRQRNCGCRKSVRYGAWNHHGLSELPLWSVWQSMIARCTATECLNYLNYTSRGITVCDEWFNDFLPFLNWALANGWEEGLQIDRIDNDSGYRPDNCRFVTPQENCQNRRSTRATPELVKAVRAGLAEGKPGKLIAFETGLSKQTVTKIKLGQNWSNVA